MLMSYIRVMSQLSCLFPRKVRGEPPCSLFSHAPWALACVLVESLCPLVWEESSFWWRVGQWSSTVSLNFGITITWATSKIKSFFPVLSIHFLKIKVSMTYNAIGVSGVQRSYSTFTCHNKSSNHLSLKVITALLTACPVLYVK